MAKPKHDEAWARGLTGRQISNGLRQTASLLQPKAPLIENLDQVKAILAEAARRFEQETAQPRFRVGDRVRVTRGTVGAVGTVTSAVIVGLDPPVDEPRVYAPEDLEPE